MPKKLTRPYPPSIQDGVTFRDPPSVLQDQRLSSELPIQRTKDDIDHGEYTELVRSKPVPQSSRRFQRMNPVPNFSSSFNATMTVPRRPPPRKPRLPVRQQPAPARVDRMLRSSVQCIDNLVEGSGSPVLIRYKTAIVVVCILLVTWQLAVLMDHLAQLVRVYCGT